jgi:RecG-like helicase
MADEQQYKREIAHKISIAELAWAGEDLPFRRVNLLATVVEKESQEGVSFKSMVVDDGTGQVRLRFFESEQFIFENAEIGDFVLVIGKPRRYGEETYITPEIIKPMKNTRWSEVRKLELAIFEKLQTKAEPDIPLGESEAIHDDVVSSEKVELYQIIKELDTGRGADISEITTKLGASVEPLIKEMVKNGDLFEVLPGRLKVLE